MSIPTTYKGRCFCGAVELLVTGAPLAMGYCHCTSCRTWSASPINAFTLWAPDAVTITRGGELVTRFQKTDRSIRKWCEQCGGHLFTEHPTWGVTDVYAGILEELRFSPMLHVNYAETVLPIRDGLPKQQDMPAEMGGTGTLLPD